MAAVTPTAPASGEIARRTDLNGLAMKSHSFVTVTSGDTWTSPYGVSKPAAVEWAIANASHLMVASYSATTGVFTFVVTAGPVDAFDLLVWAAE